MPSNRQPSTALIVAVALLPIACVNINQWLSMSAGLVPSCIPYIEGCTSISATGRYGVSYWLFKLMMLPQSVLLWLFWRRLFEGFGSSSSQARWMLRLGLTAALFLVLYTVFLGSSGDFYRLMRRYGVFVFFLGTFGAQILATLRYARSDTSSSRVVVAIQRVLLVAMLLLAIAEVPLGSFGLKDDVAENIIEWNFSLLMQCWFASWLIVAFKQRSS